MTPYEATLAELDRLEAFGIRLGLERMRDWCAAAGHPERAAPVVHVAGTNGKGTTAAAIAGLAAAHGLKAGLYTSPHVVDFRERIRIDGRPVEGDAVVAAWERVRPFAEKRRATWFEATTMIALETFATADLDLAVLETGLGGRLDATNVVDPALAVITNVARDHERHLGHDLAAIAGEKAGILKPDRPALVGDAGPATVRRVFERSARETRAPLAFLEDAVTWAPREIGRDGAAFDYDSGDLRLERLVVPPAGAHYAADAALAVRAWEVLAPRLGAGVDAGAVRRGLLAAGLPGRMEWREAGGVEVLLDVAHNPDAAGRLAATLAEVAPGPSAVVAGILADKAWTAMLDALDPVAAATWLCGLETAAQDRRLAEGDVAPALAGRERVEWAADVRTGLERAAGAVAAGRARRIVVTGSFHTVGEALVALGLAEPGVPHARPAPVGAR